MEYEFKLTYRIEGECPDADQLMNKLGDAGCTDALVGLGVAGQVSLEFIREADSAEEAILSAIKDVQSAIPNARLIEAPRRRELMGNYHPDDYEQLFNKHDHCTGRINDMLVTLQDEAYALGRKRGQADAASVLAATPAAAEPDALHDFKNFHRNLCNRFGYFHDDENWQRDLCSLEEHIAGYLKLALAAAPTPAEPVAWTLRETLDKRETTCSARLWFTNPVNSGWAPLYTAPVAATPAPAPQVLDFKCQLPGQEILHVSHDGVFTWHKDADKLIEEMDATGTKHILLALRRAATPAQAQQARPAVPVLTASDFEGRVRWWRPGKQPQLDDKLYAAPVAQAEPRKPLTDEQVAAMAKKSEFTTTACYSQAWYRAQVRAVEAAHGIGANSGGAA